MNPEFQRLLTLEFSLGRLIGMPLFLGVIFCLTFLNDNHQFGKATAGAAVFLYIVIVLFWGAKQSAESIFDELRNRTWDIQKTSAISPWSLTWGKLFGSNIFNWYGGLICMGVFTISAADEHISMAWLYAISGGLFVQSLSLLVSVFALRKKQTFNSAVSYLIVIIALSMLMPMMGLSYTDASNSISWYGNQINSRYFLSGSLILGCFWMITGIYRLLAEELQIRTLPWVWLGFIVFCCVYLGGLFAGVDYPYQLYNSRLFLLISFAVCSTLTYILLFIDKNNPMVARKLIVYFKQQQWQRFLEEIPCWLLSLLIAFPCSILLSIFFFFDTGEIQKVSFYPLVFFLFMLRDIAIVLFFSYAANPKRALGLSLLYMTFLYAFIPALSSSLGASMIQKIFLPFLFGEDVILAVIVAVLQAGIAGIVLIQRWQKSINQLGF